MKAVKTSRPSKPQQALQKLTDEAIAAAKQASTTKNLAHMAKSKLKLARRAFKVARKVARRARKEAKRLAIALEAARAKVARAVRKASQAKAKPRKAKVAKATAKKRGTAKVQAKAKRTQPVRKPKARALRAPMPLRTVRKPVSEIPVTRTLPVAPAPALAPLPPASDAMGDHPEGGEAAA